MLCDVGALLCMVLCFSLVLSDWVDEVQCVCVLCCVCVFCGMAPMMLRGLCHTGRILSLVVLCLGYVYVCCVLCVCCVCYTETSPTDDHERVIRGSIALVVVSRFGSPTWVLFS